MPPKKSFGQNFLTAQYYCERIANAVPALSQEPVLEIGPGQGALTTFLLKRDIKLHCVELDRDIIPVLKERIGTTGYTLHQADALKFDYLSIGSPLHVVGNLPYNAAAYILKKTLQLESQVSSWTFMVQREVAQRMTALPANKTMGFLSILCQFYSSSKILFNVPPGAFFPKPNVQSSVVQGFFIDTFTKQISMDKRVDFFKFVEAGYSMRRKKVTAGLRRYGAPDNIDDILTQIGCNRGCRAEELRIEDWVALYTSL